METDRDHPMPKRTIGVAPNAGADTVRRARKSGGNNFPSEKRIGQDGKSYPARRLPPLEAEIESRAIDEAEFQRRMGLIVSRVPGGILIRALPAANSPAEFDQEKS
jgi:hypothetical protein